MASQLGIELSGRVINWINNQAKRLNIAVTIYAESAFREGKWIHVPIAVSQEGDAYDRAESLQRIEDEWDPNAFDGSHLLLVPAKRQAPSKSDLYAQVGDLMKRQHLLLERIGEDNADAITAQRFRSVRHEWEETLAEMERLYPSLKNSVV